MSIALSTTSTRDDRSTRTKVALVVGGVILLAIGLQSFGTPGFPENWYLNIAEPVNDVQQWLVANRRDHWLFTFVFDPITWLVRGGLDGIEGLLTWLPWYAIPLVVFAIMARTRRWGLTVATTLAVIYPGVVGVYAESIETISLMTVSVAFSILVGVPLGIWAAYNRRVESVLRPIMDAAQTIPATIYLIPTVLLFGIGQVPAAIATIIYALPPMVRLTTLGIRQVPHAAVEASQMFGATKRQTLRRVQVPLAIPSIVTGVNQTVMMALGIVVIATLVGAGGLGQVINQTVRQLQPGRGLVVSLAVVAVAFVLDRVSQSFVNKPGEPHMRYGRRQLWWIVGGIVAAIIAGRIAGIGAFPFSWGTSFADPIDDGVAWFRDTFDVVTRPFNDFVVRDVLIRSRDLLNTQAAWQVVVLLAGAIAFVVAGTRIALFTAAGLVLVGMSGMWRDASDTIAQTIVAVVISIAIAIPVGVWLGRRPRVEGMLSPVLDSLQTIPPLIYAIPFVMIFTVGPVPGVVAAVVYAIPPGIRLTSLGIRQVNKDTIEAATTFGATERQVLWGVRIPLAMPSIILAVNQMIMMVLAMAIIAGMVGGGGLGYRSIEALTKDGGTGLGAEVAIAVVIMASTLDRLTQAAARRMQAPTAVA
jgi:glycine betaine/proline transport system permease protein